MTRERRQRIDMLVESLRLALYNCEARRIRGFAAELLELADHEDSLALLLHEQDAMILRAIATK